MSAHRKPMHTCEHPETCSLPALKCEKRNAAIMFVANYRPNGEHIDPTVWLDPASSIESGRIARII